jgi:hypothetical protein
MLGFPETCFPIPQVYFLFCFIQDIIYHKRQKFHPQSSAFWLPTSDFFLSTFLFTFLLNMFVFCSYNVARGCGGEIPPKATHKVTFNEKKEMGALPMSFRMGRIGP